MLRGIVEITNSVEFNFFLKIREITFFNSTDINMHSIPVVELSQTLFNISSLHVGSTYVMINLSSYVVFVLGHFFE